MPQRFMPLPSVKPDKVDYIFLDLDGTLLDNSARLYACYHDILAADGLPVLDKAGYMTLKRRRTPMAEILAHSGYTAGVAHYHALWMERIERDEYLDMDILKGDAAGALRGASSCADSLTIVTKRHNRQGLLRQLARLGIHDFFAEVINVPDSKAQALAGMTFETALFAGDTEDDMNAARSAGARFLAITTGLRERQFLEAEGYYACLSDIDWAAEARACHGSIS